MKKLIAMLQHRCPRCHKGHLFGTTILSFRKPFFMPGHCTECRLNYYPEPGFYYGSMFISYIITAFYCLGFMGAGILLFGFSVEGAFAWLFVSLLLLYVWFYRTARSIWIHINVRYDDEAIKRASQAKKMPEMPAYVNRNF
jgi:uncharacterized protein (DUF983 family)